MTANEGFFELQADVIKTYYAYQKHPAIDNIKRRDNKLYVYLKHRSKLLNSIGFV
jgi:hypothetical protein